MEFVSAGNWLATLLSYSNRMLRQFIVKYLNNLNLFWLSTIALMQSLAKWSRSLASSDRLSLLNKITPSRWFHLSLLESINLKPGQNGTDCFFVLSSFVVVAARSVRELNTNFPKRCCYKLCNSGIYSNWKYRKM